MAVLNAITDHCKMSQMLYLFVGLNRLAQAVMLVTCIWDVPSLNLCWDTGCPD